MKNDRAPQDGNGPAQGASRRAFLRNATAAISAGAIGLPSLLRPDAALSAAGGQSPASGGQADRVDPRGPAAEDVLTLDRFTPQMNTTFQVRVGSVKVPAELIKATPASGDKVKQQHCFSLLFRGPVAPPLEQDSYIIEHARLGSLYLFIVPMARDDDGHYYEAIFNNLV